MPEPLAAARDALTEATGRDVRLLRPVSLGGSDRSSVWRVSVRTAGDPAGGASLPRTAVVKAYPGDNPASWAREVAGLRVAWTPRLVPQVLAVASSPRVLVMEDLGRASTVADALLGRSPADAAKAVYAWVDAIAGLHLRTRDRSAEFVAELAARAPDAPAHGVPAMLDGAARGYAEQLPALGVEPPPGSLQALRELADALPLGPSAALTPADACPDNNVRVGTGLGLLDFEGAEVRHVAWDVAYALVPWPTCWCSWRLPDRVATTALARYRRRTVEAVPHAGTDAFTREVRLAVLGWCLVTAPWFLPRALAADPALATRPTPTRQAMILHRLALATTLGGPAPLVRLAHVTHAALRARWGERPLELAPAFRGTTGVDAERRLRHVDSSSGRVSS